MNKVLVIYKNKDKEKYKEEVLKTYSFLEDETMYKVSFASVDKKTKKRYDKIYIDASIETQEVQYILDHNSGATIIWVGKKDGKMKSSFTLPIKEEKK